MTYSTYRLVDMQPFVNNKFLPVLALLTGLGATSGAISEPKNFCELVLYDQNEIYVVEGSKSLGQGMCHLGRGLW